MLQKYLGKKIRQLRHRKHMTQKELADKIHMDYRYLGKVERGEINITMQSIEKIAEGLEIAPQKLF